MPLLLLLLLTVMACCCWRFCTDPFRSASARGDPGQHTGRLDWVTAGDEYVRFNEADVEKGGSGLASWVRLQIQTRRLVSGSQPRAEETRTCAVCRRTDAVDDSNGAAKAWASSPCSHHFHAKCLKAWKVFQHTQGHRVQCPLCKHALQ